MSGRLRDFLYDPDEDTTGIEAVTSLREEPPPAGPVEVPVELLMVRVLDRRYALPLLAVQEVVRPPLLTELPRGPAHVVGLMSLRGDVLAVYEPRLPLGLSLPVEPRAGPDARPAARSARVVIVLDAGALAGVWVDAVEGVVRVLPSQLDTLDPPGCEGCITLRTRQGGELLELLDVERLLG